MRVVGRVGDRVDDGVGAQAEAEHDDRGQHDQRPAPVALGQRADAVGERRVKAGSGYPGGGRSARRLASAARPRARPRRRPASAASSGSITSTRRGEATSRALIAVIAEEDRADHQRLPAPPPGEQRRGRAARSASSAQCSASQSGSRITSRGPCDQIRPTLVGEEAGVFERLFADVVPELFAAHPRERLVGFQVGVARGGEPGEDLLQPQASGGAGGEQLRVFGDDLGADPFGVAVGGQVGAGDRGPGRRRSRSARGDRARRVANRPGRDHDDQAGEQDRRPRPRPRRQSRPARAEQHDERRAARRRRGTPAGPSPVAPSSGPGSSQRQRPVARDHPPRRSPAPRRTAASPPAARSSASPGTRAGPGRPRPRRPPISPAAGPRERGARSGRRRGPRASPISARTTRASRSCDAAAQLVDAGDERAAGRGSSCWTAGSRRPRR